MPSSYLTGIFGASPIRPTERHMDKVQACVSELVPFVEAANAGDLEAMRNIQRSIATLEHEADELKRDLRRHLPHRLFMPVSRRDVLEVLHMQDEAANRAKDIAGLMLGRRMRMPEAIADDFLRFVERCVDACKQARDAINELDELVETGFGERVVELVESMLLKLDEIENDTDQMQVRIRAALFAIEKDLPAVDVMFCYKVIDWTGELANDAERIGKRLQLMLAR